MARRVDRARPRSRWAGRPPAVHGPGPRCCWDDVGARPHRGADRRSAHDQRQDHPHRPPRLPDVRVQVADDLQPVVREERHRRRGRAHGRQARGVPRVLPVAVQDEQHPRRAGDHAAQGDHHRAGRRADADRRRGRRGQRGAAAGGRHAARRPVRRRGVRPRRAAQGLRAARASGRSSSATAASARRSRRPWRRPGVGASGCSTPTRRRPRRWASGWPPPTRTLEVTHRFQGPGRATTSSSTPPRWA